MNRLEMLLEMQESNPDDEFLQYAIALEYKKNEQVVEAKKWLEKLVEEKPDYLACYYQLGKLYEEELENEAALETYKKGVEIAEKQSDKKTKGELEEAIFILEG